MTRPTTTRREFIRGLGRTAALGSIAGGAIILAGRSASRECTESTGCRSCKLLGRCDLPAAQAAIKQHNE